MAVVREKPPLWFWIVGVVLLLWALAGVGAFYGHLTMNQAGLAQMSDYDRRYFLSLPGWFIYVFAIATLGALAAAVALLLRSSVAWTLYLISLVAIVVQFGWVFGATDLIAVKGATETVPFPLTILMLGILSFWFAGVARKRGWIG